MVQIDLRKLKMTTLITLSLPIIIFLFGWVKLALALPLALLVGASLYIIDRGYKQDNKIEEKQNTLEISRGGFLFLIFAALLWCFLAGQGGFFHQTEDHNFRNALFRDLINRPWPVSYKSSNTALVYYFSYWMIPSSLGKASLLFASAGQAWVIGNFFLLCWSSLLVFLTFLLLVTKLKVASIKGIVVATLIYIFFSGLDIVGLITVQQNRSNDLEWWSYFYQYSANTTQLFWVFNQSTPTWALMLLLWQEKNIRNYAFIGLLIFVFAPIPFIGALPFLVAGAIAYAIKSYKDKKGADFWRKLFSFQNVVAVLLLFPVFALFFSASRAISDTGGGSPLQIYIGQHVWSLGKSVLIYLWFCILEFGVYALIIFKDNIKNLMFWISVISLSFIGLFRLSGKVDFAMRASIPALVVLVVLVIAYIKQHMTKISQKAKKPRFSWTEKMMVGVLVIALAIGSITPLTDYIRAFISVKYVGMLNAVEDDITTFSAVYPDGTQRIYANFMSTGYYDSDFAKFLGKEIK